MKTTQHALLIWLCICIYHTSTYAQSPTNSPQGKTLLEEPIVAALPVVMDKFLAEPKNCSIDLSWVTYSENRNRGFKIERSNDLENWETITELKGKGDSAITIHYEYSDKNPLPGTNFYKIRQEDMNDDMRYSQILSATPIDQGCFEKTIGFYPNPTIDKMFFTLEDMDLTLKRKLLISDLSGRIVQSQNVESEQFELDVQLLQKGTYIVKIEGHTPFTFVKK